jgi:hypothetical protein
MCFTATVNKGRARGATSLRRSGTSEADRTSLLMGVHIAKEAARGLIQIS